MSGVPGIQDLILGSVSFPYGSAVFSATSPKGCRSPAECTIILEISHMESNQQTESKKRSLEYVAAQELAWKLKSKQDFIVYLDQQ